MESLALTLYHKEGNSLDIKKDYYFDLYKKISDIYDFNQLYNTYLILVDLQKKIVKHILPISTVYNKDIDLNDKKIIISWNEIKKYAKILQNNLHCDYLIKLHQDEDLAFLFKRIVDDIQISFLNEDSFVKFHSNILINLQVIWTRRVHNIKEFIIKPIQNKLDRMIIVNDNIKSVTYDEKKTLPEYQSYNNDNDYFKLLLFIIGIFAFLWKIKN